MSELKAHRIDNIISAYKIGKAFCMKTEEEVYLKSEADKVIAELEEERRWRKCSDEMPEDGAEVLASDGVGIWLCYKTTLSDGSPWFQPDGLPHIEGVTHWMPLPSAPKEADK
jgi:hypothetical protein